MSEPMKAPALPWNIGPLPQECYDGDRFLCAVELHKDSGGGFSMSVVSIRCDEGYFALECEDEPWGWSGEDVTFWIKLEDRPAARDAELTALRRQVDRMAEAIKPECNAILQSRAWFDGDTAGALGEAEQRAKNILTAIEAKEGV